MHRLTPKFATMTSDPFFPPPREGINSVQRRTTTEKVRPVASQDQSTSAYLKGKFHPNKFQAQAPRRYVVLQAYAPALPHRSRGARLLGWSWTLRYRCRTIIGPSFARASRGAVRYIQRDRFDLSRTSFWGDSRRPY